jgi:hypothetical protein
LSTDAILEAKSIRRAHSLAATLAGRHDDRADASIREFDRGKDKYEAKPARADRTVSRVWNSQVKREQYHIVLLTAYAFRRYIR